MATNRERALDAAIEVLGTRGLRGLTHRAVDEAAELPTGSTSNYFRTRDALITGVVDRLVTHDTLDWQRLGQLPAPETLGQVVDGFVAWFHFSLGAGRTRTRARYALFVEAAGNEPIQAALRAGRGDLAAWGLTVLANVGGGEQECAILMAYLDGLMFHQCALAEPGFDPRPGIDRLTRAILG